MNPSLFEGSLTVSDVMSPRRHVVDERITLGELLEVVLSADVEFILVADANGRLVGVVSGREVLEAVRAAGVGGRDWWGRTVGSVMTTKLVTTDAAVAIEDAAALVQGGSIRCLPVVEEGRLVGVMTPGDLLVSWSRLQPTLERAALDPLTGVANRTTFDRRLEEEWDRSQRRQLGLTVVVVDCDRFKSINDSYGHSTGDAVLRMLGSALARHLRRYDVVARIGGDEFAAICCECGPDEVRVPLERLRDAVRRVSLPTGPDAGGLTLSIGAAIVTGTSSYWPSAVELVEAADTCLYEAKRHGRDRIWYVEFDGRTREPYPKPFCTDVPSRDDEDNGPSTPDESRLELAASTERTLVN